MPLMFRAMLPDDTGERPLTGEGRDRLGVRLPPRPITDVDIDSSGCVALNQKGMSVVPHPKDLSYFLLPKEMGGRRPKVRLWKHGDGAFVDSAVNNDLMLWVTDPKHGVVAPSQSVTMQEYLKELAATRDGWLLVETTE